MANKTQIYKPLSLEFEINYEWPEDDLDPVVCDVPDNKIQGVRNLQYLVTYTNGPVKLAIKVRNTAGQITGTLRELQPGQSACFVEEEDFPEGHRLVLYPPTNTGKPAYAKAIIGGQWKIYP